MTPTELTYVDTHVYIAIYMKCCQDHSLLIIGRKRLSR